MTNKTQPTDVPVNDFLNAVEHPVRRADGLQLDALFRRVTGWQPVMWGLTLLTAGLDDLRTRWPVQGT